MVDPETDQAELGTKNLHRNTYTVMLILLVFGQFQDFLVMGYKPLKRLLAATYYISLAQFFISFISIQLYVFFFHVLSTKSIWKRFLAGLWTYEMNTISIMKPAKGSAFIYHIISFLLTYLVMGIGVLYGNIAKTHSRGLFVTRHNVIRWSERLFVLTSFGIIVCSEMRRSEIEFPTLVTYGIMSIIFVVIFAASIRKPNFYRVASIGDHILIGQLYYLNYYALYMGHVWMTASLVQFAGWENSIRNLFKHKSPAMQGIFEVDV